MEINNRKRRNRKSNKLNIIKYILLAIVIVQTVVSIYVVYLLNILNILSMLYFMLSVGVLITLIGLVSYFIFHKKKVLRWIGIVVSILVLVFATVTALYTNRTIRLLNTVTGVNHEEITYDLYVLKSSGIKSVNDAANAETCLVKTADKGIGKAVEIINANNGVVLKEHLLVSYDVMLRSLYDGSCKSILFNDGFFKLAEEMKPNFKSDIRKITSVKIEIKAEEVDTKKIDITSENVNIYLSGNDSYGSILSNGRSDVNMLVTINQRSHKVLMTNIPRDYYVPLTCANGAKDKLTHAGVYGIDCSMNTVSQLFNTKIDHYVKVNFTSFIKIIDNIGGVDVDVHTAFSTGKHTFTVGNNHMDAEKALAFSRDRKHQDGGDRGRGENQQLVIKAIIKKLASPSIANNFMSVLDSFANSFASNLKREQITMLLQQLVEKGEYQTESQSVDGSGGMSTTYTYSSQPLSVIFPNQTSVEQSKKKITEYLN